MEAEVLLSEGALERLVTTYEGELSATLDAGLSLRVADGSLPYSLTVVESDAGRAAGLLMYVTDGSVCGFVGYDGRAAVEWAEAEFERRWEAGTELPEPGGGWEPDPIALGSVAASNRSCSQPSRTSTGSPGSRPRRRTTSDRTTSAPRREAKVPFRSASTGDRTSRTE
jgi:hypothetical protein